MSQDDLKRQGLRHGPSANKGYPERMFIVGHDGEGATEAERVEWIRSIFPKFADRLNPKDNDPRANLPIPEEEIRVFDAACAKPVIYETMNAFFPDEGCGKWNGLPLLVVNTGRQTTKIARIINERRAPSPPTEIVVMAKRYAATLDRLKANVIENRRIVPASPTERAWGAHRLIEHGTPREEAMTLAGVKTEQGLKNLLALLDGSPKVQAAVNLGPDEPSGITQRVALDIIKLVDHDKQDAELARRLDAAKGKSGRARSTAINGGDKQKPVKIKTLARVTERLTTADRTDMTDPHRVDEWLAIVKWAQGDVAAYDALPDEFKDAVLATKKVERVKKEPKAKPEGGKRQVKKQPSAEPVAVEVVEQREAA